LFLFGADQYDQLAILPLHNVSVFEFLCQIGILQFDYFVLQNH
jgi:hypothetical protein